MTMTGTVENTVTKMTVRYWQPDMDELSELMGYDSLEDLACVLAARVERAVERGWRRESSLYPLYKLRGDGYLSQPRYVDDDDTFDRENLLRVVWEQMQVAMRRDLPNKDIGAVGSLNGWDWTERIEMHYLENGQHMSTTFGTHNFGVPVKFDDEDTEDRFADCSDRWPRLWPAFEQFVDDYVRQEMCWRYERNGIVGDIVDLLVQQEEDEYPADGTNNDYRIEHMEQVFSDFIEFAEKQLFGRNGLMRR